MPQLMDSRLIFLHLDTFSMGRRRKKEYAHYWICVDGVKIGAAGKSTALLSMATIALWRNPPQGGNVFEAPSKKILYEPNVLRPYRKPTQVGGASSPRCTSERSPRNSANK